MKILLNLLFGISLVLFFSQATKAQVDDEEFLTEEVDDDFLKADEVFLIEAEEVSVFNELDYAFYQAYTDFLGGREAAAGSKIRRAAYLVKIEAENVKAHNKKPIFNQADKLNKLADKLALGEVHQPYKLRKAFFHTHHVLAKDYKLRAAEFWAADKSKDAGHAIVVGVWYLGYAAKWSGKKIEQGVVGTGKGAKKLTVESYKGLRWLGSKMIKGIAFVPSNVGKGLEWLGKGIKKLGDEIDPSPVSDENE